MGIRRLASAKKTGVFENFQADGEETDFKKLNAIYGFNGSGKTTLSRIFQSLERGEICPLLPEGGRFEIELDDGSVICADANLDMLKGKIAVFNTDFVEDNFQWKECSAKPVFYIGKEQADTGRELEAVQLKLEPAKEKRSTSAVAKNAAGRLFAQFKTNTARTIGEQTNQRAFNAGHFERQMQKAEYGPEKTLTEERRDELRSTILKDAPLAKLPEQVRIDGFVSFARQARECLSKTVGTSTLLELEQHPQMVNWVKVGQQYHREHGLSDCLLCGNVITSERMDAIDRAIDDAFDKLATETNDLLTTAALLREKLAGVSTSLPSKNDVSGDQQGFDDAALRLRDSAKALLIAMEPFEEALAKKAAAPNTRVDDSKCCQPAEAEALQRAMAEALERVNEVLRGHNKAHDEFADTQTKAREALMGHYLAEASAEYQKLKAEQEEFEKAAADAEAAVIALEAEISTLTQRVRDHGPAANVINALIKSYLRHGDIEIVADTEGFQLRRYGRHVARNLSEGEKTAITLCYFLSSLTADGRKLKDLVVVVDDPISSLDSKALNYAFSVLKGHVAGAHQLIILTHNVNFMNECRKWLKGKVDKGVAALLFLDMRKLDGVRQTKVVKLPKLLREYDSEYHYLFSLVKNFAESAEQSEELLFLMPNAMRKVAEVYLSFKRPGNNGLADKVEALAGEAEDIGIDGDRFRAIDRLVQVESHGDSLEDLVAFSSMTVEESHQCAVALMEIMEKLDGEHYTRMCRQCG
jgi:wobble nucleotide-excising tRNase